MKNYLLLFALISSQLLAFNLAAQNQTVLKGMVYTSPGLPVNGATVAVYGTELNPLGNTLTAPDGSFKIALNKQAAYVQITHVGYLSYKITRLKTDTIVVVYLTPQTHELAEVVIKSQKPFIEQQFDRLVVNVNGDPKAGMNAMDVLKKVPGVALPNGENVMLEGKGVTIYLDGKPARLNGRELMALLANTPSISISQIEVMHSPSAKFDAQGDGGVINIKTIRRNKPGYDAGISVTGGHGWKYFSNNNAYAALNYRQGSNYIYGSYSYGFGQQAQEIRTVTYLEGAGQRLIDYAGYKTPYRDQNIRLGWDHYLNKKDVFGVLVNAYKGHYDPAISSQTGIYAITAASPDSTRYTDNSNLRTSKGININLNYKLVLDSARMKEVSMDADGGVFSYHNINQIGLQLTNANQSPVGPVQQLLQAGDALTRIYSYKADYTQKLYKGNLEGGVKASYVNVDNQFKALSGLAGATLMDNSSNDFLYKETVLAAFVSSKQVFGKLTLQAGLRGEQTYTNGNSVTMDSVVSRSYLNLFPNVIAGYKLKNGSLSASYSRRVGRPYYNYLNPFVVVRGAYSVYQGNPYLQPSFTNNYRLGYTLNSGLGFALAYSTVTNVITDLALVNEQTKTTTTLKANLNNNNNGSFYLSYNHKLFRLLNVNYTAGMAHNRYQFIYGNAPVVVKQLTGFTYLDNQVNLPNEWWFDVYIYAQSRVTYGNQINMPLFTTQASGGKKLLKGKGNLSVNINDIFFTGVQRSEANYANVHNHVKSKYDSRNLRVSFSYSFGNAKVDVRRRSSGSADEQRRSQ